VEEQLKVMKENNIAKNTQTYNTLMKIYREKGDIKVKIK
jgi:hypothetical protein